MTVGSCFRAVRVAIPDIEEPASCGVNNGKGEVVPGGPTKCQSRTKLHQWKLEGSRCPGLSRWLDDNSPTPAFDQIAPRTNPKLVLLDKEPETLGNQFQVAIRLFCGCLWGDDLPPRAVPQQRAPRGRGASARSGLAPHGAVPAREAEPAPSASGSDPGRGALMGAAAGGDLAAGRGALSVGADAFPARGGAREAGNPEREGVDGALRPAAGAAGGGRPRGVRTPTALEAGRPDPRARGRDQREEGASQTEDSSYEQARDRALDACSEGDFPSITATFVQVNGGWHFKPCERSCPNRS